jgi:hypothetical protein
LLFNSLCKIALLELVFSPRKKRAGLALVAGLLGLSLLLTACGDTAPPADVAQHYLENIRDSAYASAYDLLSSDSQLKVSRSQFVDRLTRAKTEAGITRTDIVKVQPPNIVGKRASVAYQVEVTTQDNRKLPLFESLVVLQQEDGWRVVWPPQ